MMQAETLENFNVNTPLSGPKSNRPFYEAGQLRRAKMHAARLIETIDNKKMLTPVLYRLLEASFVLETTDTKILSAHLKRTPATIRLEFQKICEILGQSHDAQTDPLFLHHKNNDVVNI
ncbi:MAG: hypothetical protein KGN35_01530 [Betaproteobacteria bacterium]|nr:hypothetical protein [Betaproteobacteria bacterium]